MRIILLCSLAIAATPATADWVKVMEADTKEYVAYADPATLRKDGDGVTRWMKELVDLRKRDPYGEMSTVSLMEFDCARGNSRFLAITYYTQPMGKGHVLRSSDSPGSWYKPSLGTYGRDVLKYACAL